MWYYDYLNKKIGSEFMMKGRNYPYYSIDYMDCYEELSSIVHLFYVRAKTSMTMYEVEIKNNGENIYDSTCTCHQYKNYHKCEHIAACLWYYRGEIINKRKIDVYKESKDILDLFYEPTTNINVKERLNLELKINFYQNDINFRLSVGSKKLYVLNTPTKFNNFINAYYNGGDDVLGTKLTFNRNNYYFDEEDASIIDYLSSFESNNYYYSSDAFNINERDFNYIISHLSLDKIKINNNVLKNVIHDIPSSFKLTKNDSDDYELKISFKEGTNVLTDNFKYIFSDNNLYIVPDNYRKILSELAKREISSLVFSKKDVEKFSRGVLKNIKDKITIDENVDIKIDTKPSALIYLDIASNLTCKLNFKYGTTEINCFDDTKEIIRDYSYEEIVLQELVNSGFKIVKNKLLMKDLDSIGNFIENKLPDLTKTYNVYTSKKLDKISVIKKSNIKKNFSIGVSGIMSFDFNADNINAEELKDIFASLEAKKNYHKLKNGNILNLAENAELQDLNSLINDLELDPSNMSKSLEIPKYRALYIDSLRTHKYQDITTNNIFDEFVSNFNTYKELKIKFAKEDKEILRDYQKVGVRWLYTIYKCDLGGILADEMGLGKSIQTICFLKEVLKEKKNVKILIVCPTSLVYNWGKEFDKFGPELKYTTISDNKTKRTEILNSSDFNIFITSYGLLRNDIKEYQEKDFEVCIIDEAQYIKNYQAKMTIALKSIKARTRLALTGTPLENSVTELWSIFDFLMPGYLNSVKKFHEKYHISDVTKEDLERLESLNYQIKPFILRRKKSEVYKDLPDKIENNVYLELPDTQKKLYLSVLKETEKEINEIIEKEGFLKARFKILTLLTKLREICINPSVIYENYDGEAIKIEKLIEMIKDYVKENHKILIFSSFKRVLDLLKIKLDKEHITYYSIDGSVKGSERLPLVDKFNEDDTNCFLITLKSGGTGLNLTSADIVIHLDIWWNPQAENQATDRAHRIGQTKKVIVNKLITKGTIEERILELQTKKRILSDNLIEGNTNTENISALTEDELRNLLTFSED